MSSPHLESITQMMEDLPMSEEFKHIKGWLGFADAMVGQATETLGCLTMFWFLFVCPVLAIAVAIKWLFG